MGAGRPARLRRLLRLSGLGRTGRAGRRQGGGRVGRQQPWSTGKVGMYGKSYDGVTGLIGIAQQPQGRRAVRRVCASTSARQPVARPGHGPVPATARGAGADWPPADRRTPTTPRTATARRSGHGIWTTRAAGAHFAGVPEGHTSTCRVAPENANLVVDVYDIDSGRNATLIWRGAYLLSGNELVTLTSTATTGSCPAGTASACRSRVQRRVVRARANARARHRPRRAHRAHPYLRRARRDPRRQAERDGLRRRAPTARRAERPTSRRRRPVPYWNRAFTDDLLADAPLGAAVAALAERNRHHLDQMTEAERERRALALA